MKNFKEKILVLGLTIFVFSLSLVAAPFAILGSRPLGMGGAFVAVSGQSPASPDALTQYWNPAALGLHRGFDIEVPVGAGVEATGGILNLAKSISDSAQKFDRIIQAQKDGSYITLDEIKAFAQGIKNLSALNTPGMGLSGAVGAGINSSSGRWAVSVNNFSFFGVDPNIDVSNLFLGSGTVSSLSIRRGISFVDGESYSGIDLSKILDSGVSTASPSDPELRSASSDLASVIDTLASEAGVSLGGYTSSEIANALINYAERQPGVSKSDIISAVQTIKDAQPLLEKLLGGNYQSIFARNQSNITVRGISVSELAVGYGQDCSFLSSSLNKLYVGANVKYLYGVVGYLKQSVWEEGVVTSETVLKDFTKNYKGSNALSLDFGLLYDLKENYRFRAGLVGKNINKPEFSQPEAAVLDGLGDKFVLDSQWRTGVAVWPFNWLLISADYDLTENKTVVNGYNSRVFALGTELNILNRSYLNLSLRAGAFKNLASQSSPLTYTAGVGLNLLHFVLDLSGAISSETVEIENGKSIPSFAYLMLGIGFNF